MREMAINMLAVAKAMYGVELAVMGEKNLVHLERRALRAMWGPARVTRAREMLWAFLGLGHRVSPVWLWLARQAHTPRAR